jgi:paraquat-inducible protein B
MVSLDTMTTQISEVMEANGPKLSQLLDTSTRTIEEVGAEIPQLSASARDTLRELDSASVAFEEAMRGMADMVSDDSSTRYQLDLALKEIARASRALQLLARSLEEQPDALIRGRKEETR